MFDDLSDKDRNNCMIRAQIAMLESTQPRALREFALGSTTATARLQDIDNQIAALRLKLEN